MQLCHRETHRGTKGDAEHSGGLGTGPSQEFYSTSGAGHSSLRVLVTQAIQPQKEDGLFFPVCISTIGYPSSKGDLVNTTLNYLLCAGSQAQSRYLTSIFLVCQCRVFSHTLHGRKVPAWKRYGGIYQGDVDSTGQLPLTVLATTRMHNS